MLDTNSNSERARDAEARLAKTLSELHLWQERYRAIGETIPHGIWICDAEGRLTYCSQAILDLLGMTMEQVAGAGWYDTLHPDDAAETERAWNECVHVGQDWVRLHRYKGKDSRYYPALARGRAIRNPDGTVREWVGVNYDVSELIEVQDKLHAASAQLTEDLAKLSRLHQLSLVLLRAGNGVQHNLDTALDVAIEMSGADKGNIQIFDALSTALTIAAQHGFDPPFLRFFESVRDDRSACAAAMRSGQRIIVQDVANNELFDDQSRKIMLEAEARAVVSVPLMSSRGMLLGMMSVHFRRPHRPSEAELTRLELVARQTADYLERKRAEEAETTLRRELQHRSENLLAVVGSIARRTLSTSGTLEDAAKALEGRLQALNRANRRLADSGWHKVDLAEIVCAELSMIPDRTSFEGSRMELDPQYGQRFALLMHELMTNAMKYGALSGPSGQVTVSWRVKDDGPGQILRFRWQERDGPPVSAPARRGFGSCLFETIFPQSRVEYAVQGFTYAADLPLERSGTL